MGKWRRLAMEPHLPQGLPPAPSGRSALLSCLSAEVPPCLLVAVGVAAKVAFGPSWGQA